MHAEEDVPCVVKMTAAAAHDVPFIQGLALPKGSIVTFDKGYIDYAQYDLWTKQKVWWVTRLKKGAQYQIVEQLTVSDQEYNKGVRADARIILGHQTHDNVVRTPARLVIYHDKESGKDFQFITNHGKFNASIISLIYKNRWQIELLYKRIKQNYPLRYFLGENENAIRIQIWCALIADLLLKFVQAKLKRSWSFGNLSSMVRIHLMSYLSIFKFLEHPDRILINSMVTYNKGPTLFD
jgi:IS4 transposase